MPCLLEIDPHTRVTLFLKFGIAHSDYINANYIRVTIIIMTYAKINYMYLGLQGTVKGLHSNTRTTATYYC